nr:MAG TPA: hypothetical protein [Caudoviricetes sp.]
MCYNLVVLGNFVLLKFPKLRSIATKLWRTVILFY